MMDIIILGIFIGICLTVFAVIFAIPKLVVLLTESKVDPNHIYNIFMAESGYRGWKTLSPAGCLFPFIELSKPTSNAEGIVFVAAVCTGCFIYHLSVYKGYPVLTQKMKLALILILSFLTAVSLLAKFEIITGSATIFLIPIGVVWGSYAVYRRSTLIRIARCASREEATCPP